MASASGQVIAYHTSGHYTGMMFDVTASRSGTAGDANIYITGTVRAGLWGQVSSTYNDTDIMGSLTFPNGYTATASGHITCSYPGCTDQFNYATINTSFYWPSQDNIRMDAYTQDSNPGQIWGAGSGTFYIGGIPPYVPPCDPNPVGPWGNAFPTVPSHPTNPNTQLPLPTNTILQEVYNGSQWEITYPRTTLENVYRYAPMIRAMSNNKSESDAFNIPFDKDESPIPQRWGYYDNTYFYIYRDGLYDISCYTAIVDRKAGVGPKNCNRNVDGNNYAWLKVSKNPDNGNATFLTGRVSHNYGNNIDMGVHNIVPLKAGDKVFARVGWQYGNGSTCDGVSGCQGGISYNMACTIAGVNSGYDTRMIIVPLVFFDEEITYN